MNEVDHQLGAPVRAASGGGGDRFRNDGEDGCNERSWHVSVERRGFRDKPRDERGGPEDSHGERSVREGKRGECNVLDESSWVRHPVVVMGRPVVTVAERSEHVTGIVLCWRHCRRHLSRCSSLCSRRLRKCSSLMPNGLGRRSTLTKRSIEGGTL